MILVSTGHQTVNAWEAQGVPDSSEADAEKQTLITPYRVRAEEEDVVRVLQFGLAMNFCGSLSPNSTRDEYGCCRISGRWAHSQHADGYVVYKISPSVTRRFIVCHNSHGPRYNGPKGEKTPDLPDGSYLLDIKDFLRIVAEGDTWVNADPKGLEEPGRDWTSRIGEDVPFARAA